MRRENTSLLDIQYVNRDGDSMRGPLALHGHPVLAAEAANKAYVDLVVGNLGVLSLPRDGSLPMLGPLTLAGPPTGGRQATTRDYVTGLLGLLATTAYVDAQDVIDRAYADGLDAAQRAYLDAQDALRLLLGGGSMTGPLTLSGAPVDNLHAATKLYVDNAVPPASLSTFDAVVAAAGGDYTTIEGACAGEAAGARIFVKRGTYTPAGNVTMLDGQQLIGENPEDTIIDFGGANRRITSGGGISNLEVSNFTLQNGVAASFVNLGGDYSRIDNCRFIGSAAANGGVITGGQRTIISRCNFTGFTKAGVYCVNAWNYNVVMGNTFLSSRRAIAMSAGGVIVGNHIFTMTEEQIIAQGQCAITGNYLAGNQKITLNAINNVVSGNYITGAEGIVWGGAHNGQVITGNSFLNSQVNCANAAVEDCTITGNSFDDGAGIVTEGEGFAITGNMLLGTAFITLGNNSKYCTVVGNSLSGSTAAAVIVDTGVANTAKDNSGVNALMEKHFTKVRNTSGGLLVAGDVVVFKAVAAGDEVDTTVAQGDDMVYGMLDENIANAAYGYVQDEGKTIKLKVNGVVNIGVGDLLGTLDAAAIARQAAAGDMAFAIALEAYAGADSNGVIDALLIKPRKV